LNYPWEVSVELKRQLRHLPPDLKRQVRSVMDQIEKDPESGKPLEDDLAGFRSFRIGRYRLIYVIQGDRLVMEAFGSRRDIYERFVLELARQKIRERTAKYAAKPHKRRFSKPRP